MKCRRPRAEITRLQAIVTLAVIAALVTVVWPYLAISLFKGQITRSLSNMRQLALATQQSGLDRYETLNSSLGWPADTGGTFTNWAKMLTEHNYLTPNDLSKLLSGPGIKVPIGRIPNMAECALRVYSVGASSSSSTVLFTSANFTNTATGGAPPAASAKPFGNKGFVVFRKGGDGNIFQPDSAGKTNRIGEFAPLCQ